MKLAPNAIKGTMWNTVGKCGTEWNRIEQEIADINLKIEAAQDQRAEMEQREASSTSENVEVIPYLNDSTSEDGNNGIGKPDGYINAEEIADRYKQSKKWVHYLTRQKKVPRVHA